MCVRRNTFWKCVSFTIHTIDELSEPTKETAKEEFVTNRVRGSREQNRKKTILDEELWTRVTRLIEFIIRSIVDQME